MRLFQLVILFGQLFHIHLAVRELSGQLSSGGVELFQFRFMLCLGNALIVYEGGVATNKIVAIIVNTNSDTNVLGKTDVMGTKTVTAPGSVTMTNANGLTASAVADKQTAVKGEAITYTVTFSGTTTAATKVMFTAGSNSTVDTAKCVVTGNWVAQSATQANIATTKDGTGTVTFKVIANGSGSVGAPTIAVANQ